MNQKEAIEGTIEHWKRMIAWVEKQDPKWRVDETYMRREIGEEWRDEDCPLCTFTGNVRLHCKICPLGIRYGRCSYNTPKNKKNKWIKVQYSHTWGEWLENAREFLKQIESLLED